MMAVVYLALMVAVGDTLSRPILRPASLIHRLVAAYLVGLVVSTWFTYLLASALSSLVQPLALADPIVIAIGLAIVGARTGQWVRRHGRPTRRRLRLEL